MSTAPARFGGLESVVRGLAAGLVTRGHAVTVATVLDHDDPDHPFVRQLEEAGTTVECLVVPPRRYLEEFRAVRALLDTLGPDVLHTHGYRADVIHGRAGRSRLPVVSTVHGFTGNSIKNRLFEWLQLRALRRNGWTIAVSDGIAARLRRSRIPRVEVVPNTWAGPEPLSRELARQALRIDDHDRFHVGWVGRLSREKDPVTAIRAVNTAGLDDAVLHIVGDGPEATRIAAELERTGSTGLELRMHGAVPEAGRYVTAFDAFLLTSRTEGSPIAVFEALYARTPIVATAVGGVPEVLRGGVGLLAAPGDAATLAKHLRDIRNDPGGARERAAAGHERLLARYAADKWIDAHLRIYRELADHTDAGSSPTAG